MFKKALSPSTNVVVAAGTTRTIGFPLIAAVGSKVKPAGCASIPAKIAARRTEMKVKKAEAVASLESVSNVRGKEQIQEMTVMMAEKPIVQTE